MCQGVKQNLSKYGFCHSSVLEKKMLLLWAHCDYYRIEGMSDLIFFKDSTFHDM